MAWEDRSTDVQAAVTAMIDVLDDYLPQTCVDMILSVWEPLGRTWPADGFWNGTMTPVDAAGLLVDSWLLLGGDRETCSGAQDVINQAIAPWQRTPDGELDLSLHEGTTPNARTGWWSHRRTARSQAYYPILVADYDTRLSEDGRDALREVARRMVEQAATRPDSGVTDCDSPILYYGPIRDVAARYAAGMDADSVAMLEAQDKVMRSIDRNPTGWVEFSQRVGRAAADAGEGAYEVVRSTTEAARSAGQAGIRILDTTTDILDGTPGIVLLLGLGLGAIVWAGAVPLRSR